MTFLRPTRTAAALLALCLAAKSHAIEVTNANDSGPGSLRAALSDVSPTVTFNTTFFTTPRTITLASGLAVTTGKTITGPGAANLTIDGVDLYRCLTIDRFGTSNYTVSISGLRFTRGRNTTSGGGAILSGDYATLQCSNCVFDNNQAVGAGVVGGAITISSISSPMASHEITGCSFTGNTAERGGGAVHVRLNNFVANNNLHIRECSFTNNSSLPSFGKGGGVYIEAGFTKISRCSFENNAAWAGGGCYVGGGVVNNWVCTYSGHTSSLGGMALHNEGGTLGVFACTVTDSASPFAAGAPGIFLASASVATNISSSIVARNMSGSLSFDIDGAGPLTQSNNLIGRTTTPGVTNGTNGTKLIDDAFPLLAPMGNYGGSTRTRPPLPGSPAEFLGGLLFDGGAAVTPDQRGVAFLGSASVGLSCGAVQQRAFTVTAVSGSGQSTVINTAFANPIVLSVAGTGGDPVNGGNVRLRPVAVAGATLSSTADFNAGPIAGGQVSITGLTANGAAGAHILRVIQPTQATLLDIPLTNTGIPDINITGNSVSIANGDTTPSTADHTDFGSVAAVGAGTLSRAFTIQNTGGGPLTWAANPVTFTNLRQAVFTVTTQPAGLSLAAGSSATFTITYNPALAGTDTVTVSIATNDPDESPYTFNITAQATGAAPTDILLSNTSIAENGGTVVGGLSRVNGEAGTPTYTLVSGTGSTDNALTNIANGSLFVNAPANFETKSSYSVRVRVTEPSGANFEKALTFTITNVNEAPSFTAGPAPQVARTITATQTIPGWATNIDDGDATVAQMLTFTTTVLTGANLFQTAPTVNTNGQLSFQPNNTGLTGTATVRVTLQDDATINGGAALTTSQVISFYIGIAPPGNRPTITGVTITPRAAGGKTVTVTATGPAGLGNRSWQLRHSSDLQTWTTLTTQTSTATGTITFSNIADPGGTGVKRFYRVEVP
jgi:hypothetical protein